MALVDEPLRSPGQRRREHLGGLDAPDRPRHLDPHAAVGVLERRPEPVRPVGRHPQLLLIERVGRPRIELGAAVEAERLGVLPHARQGGDRGPVVRHRLHHGHQRVVDERVGGPALAEVRRLARFGVADVRRAHVRVRPLDRQRRARDQEVDEVPVGARDHVVLAAEPDRVGGRLVVGRGDLDVVEVVAVGGDFLADPVGVGVEQALVVDHLHRHRPAPVGDHQSPGADLVGDVVVVAGSARAAAERVPVPPAVVVAVDERVAHVVVAVALLVDVRLLEREVPLAGERSVRRRQAVGRVGLERARGRRGVALDGGAGSERGGRRQGGAGRGARARDPSYGERHPSRCPKAPHATWLTA